MQEEAKIVIIGAGLAGLSYAYFLREYDLKSQITIIEANDEPGGKVKDTEVNGEIISLGGIIVLSWYKNMLSLCSELGVEYIKQPLYNYKIGFDLEETFTPSSINIKPLIFDSLKLFPKIIFDSKRYKLSPFEIRNNTPLSSLSAKEYLDKKIGRDSLLSKYFECLLNSFGYPGLQFLPAELFIPFASNLVTSAHKPRYVIKGGPHTLIKALVKRLKELDVNFSFNDPVNAIDAKSKTVKAKRSYKFDKLLLTTAFDPNLAKNISWTGFSIDYTDMMVFTVYIDKQNYSQSRFQKILRTSDRKQPISIVFINLESDSDHQTSIYSIYTIINDKSSDNEVHLRTKRWLNKIGLAGHFKIVKRHRWRKMMPYQSPQAMQGFYNSEIKNQDISWISDFMGFPSMEASIYRAKKSADNTAQRLKKLI